MWGHRAALPSHGSGSGGAGTPWAAPHCRLWYGGCWGAVPVPSPLPVHAWLEGSLFSRSPSGLWSSSTWHRLSSDYVPLPRVNVRSSLEAAAVSLLSTGRWLGSESETNVLILIVTKPSLDALMKFLLGLLLPLPTQPILPFRDALCAPTSHPGAFLRLCRCASSPVGQDVVWLL